MKNMPKNHDSIARSATYFEWPIRIYWEDTDTGVLGVWTS